jgi:hypothetical protein
LTNRQELRDAGLSDEEIDAMQDEGTMSWTNFDVEKNYDIMEKYLDANMPKQAERMLDVAEQNIDFWKTYVQDLTGKSIEYHDSGKHWYDTDTGKYCLDPYPHVFENTDGIVHADQYEMDQYIINRYG